MAPSVLASSTCPTQTVTAAKFPQCTGGCRDIQLRCEAVTQRKGETELKMCLPAVEDCLALQLRYECLSLGHALKRLLLLRHNHVNENLCGTEMHMAVVNVSQTIFTVQLLLYNYYCTIVTVQFLLYKCYCTIFTLTVVTVLLLL